MLIIRVQGGFCNRLRAIVSTVLWAEDLNVGLIIHWPEEPGHMACRMDEILDIKTIPRLIEFHTGYIRNARQVLSHADMESVMAVQGLLRGSEIRIESYSIFHNDLLHRSERALDILRKIDVLPYLRSKVDCVKEGLVGIHIRRTDHVKCIAASPLSAFENYLNSASGENFLLATDDAEVKAKFKEIYKNSRYLEDLPHPNNSLVSPVTVLGRVTKEQQINGIVDWLLLQRCTRIVASKGSSFSELAAWRAGIPLVCV
jgi:hypothetical protein